MRIIRYHDLEATPWKNGGGVTREIARYPTDSQLDDFGWRISTAIVSQEGLFSRFEGVDRHLILLEGTGLELVMEKDETKRLLAGDYITFPGETSINAKLMDRAIADLNVMVRRSRYRAVINEVVISGQSHVDLPWSTVAIFICSGTVRVGHDAYAQQAGARDTILFDAAHDPSISLEGHARGVLIGIEPRR